MELILSVANSKANVKRVVLKSDTLIGRHAACDLRVASDLVSRRHCLLVLRAGQVWVRDLGSANGTFLNSVRLAPYDDVPLERGQELAIGPLRLVVEAIAEQAGEGVELPLETVHFFAEGIADTVAELKNPAQPAVPPAAETPRNEAPQDPGGSTLGEIPISRDNPYRR